MRIAIQIVILIVILIVIIVRILRDNNMIDFMFYGCGYVFVGKLLRYLLGFVIWRLIYIFFRLDLYDKSYKDIVNHIFQAEALFFLDETSK